MDEQQQEKGQRKLKTSEPKSDQAKAQGARKVTRNKTII